MAKVETPELLTINNPNYKKLIRDYSHLRNVIIDDCDTNDRLPIHLVLGNGEYARIKTSTKPVIGGDNEPVAEKTKLGWFIMSPGIDFDRNTMLLTQTAHSDFESLCRLDVLGLADTIENDQNAFRTILRNGCQGTLQVGTRPISHGKRITRTCRQTRLLVVDV